VAGLAAKAIAFVGSMFQTNLKVAKPPQENVMTRLISLASGTLPEFGPVDVVHAAAEGGFGGSGIWFDAPSWTQETTAAVAEAFAQTGLRPLEIEVVAVEPGPLNPEHERLLECGATVGATECIVVSSDPDLGAFTARFAELCEIGERVGVNVCLEFLPIYQVRDLATSLGVLAEVAHPRGKLLLDPLHMARSGASLAEIREIPAELLTFAQFCDAPAELAGERTFDALLSEAVDGRLNPGKGGLPLRELLTILGPDLPLSLELRSKALRDAFPDAVDRARNVFQDTAAFLA
jgi:sugar phosphate isomerase/epimerase